MPRYTNSGTPFLACDAGCADAFKMDRACGLNYGLHKRPDGGLYLHREQWSMMEKQCAYCGAPQQKQKEVSVEISRSERR